MRDEQTRDQDVQFATNRAHPVDVPCGSLRRKSLHGYLQEKASSPVSTVTDRHLLAHDSDCVETAPPRVRAISPGLCYPTLRISACVMQCKAAGDR